MCTDCNEITIPIGPTGATGATGPQGPSGTNGTNGTNGSNGTTILSSYNSLTGIGTPNSLVETSLFSYTIPANTLNINGDELELYTYFETLASTLSGILRIKLGSKIYSLGLVNANNAYNILKIKITRIASNSQLWTISWQPGASIATTFTTSTVDLTTILTFEITGENQTAGLNNILLKKASLYKYAMLP